MDKNQIITKNAERPDRDFFYRYKQMSISSNNLYKVDKGLSELREDRAVQLYFLKNRQIETNKRNV